MRPDAEVPKDVFVHAGIIRAAMALSNAAAAVDPSGECPTAMPLNSNHAKPKFFLH